MSAVRTSTAALEVDLVNAALLGTDRRGVPAPADADPADWLLEAAGRRRAANLVAGASTVVRLAEPAPAVALAMPSREAREILDDVLLEATTVVLDLWLREALAAGVGLAPEHWTPVLERSRRSTGLDRRRVAAALGPRGLWFARHNPAWSLVVRAASEPSTVDDTFADGPAREAIDVLAAGEQAVGGARALGQRVGARLPLAAYAYLVATRPVPNAAAGAGLAAAEEVLRVRWALAHAFDPARVPPERRQLPSVPTLQERL